MDRLLGWCSRGAKRRADCRFYGSARGFLRLVCSATLPLATPALAHAGTGDVLAGLITGLRAQGVTAFEATCTAVWVHGHAGLRAAALMGGTAGVLAGDLIAEIPDLIGV